MRLDNSIKEEYYIEENGNKVSSSSFNVSWCKQLGVEPKIVFDIGSCDCGDAIRFEKAFDCLVYSFEASPEKFEYCETVSENYNITVYNYAVYSKNGIIEFYPSLDLIQNTGGAQGSIYKHTQQYKNNYKHIKQLDSVIVDAITVKSFCKEKNIKEIDVAHIDVEGGEYHVVCGFGEIRPKIVWVETLNDDFWDGCSGINTLHNKLIELGYCHQLTTSSDRLYSI